MRRQSGGRAAIIISLVFALGVLVGSAGTIGLEAAKVRQLVIAQLEGKPAANGAARISRGIERLVSRELSLGAKQRASLADALQGRMAEIEKARSSMGADARAIAWEVYAEVKEGLSVAQREKAESILR